MSEHISRKSWLLITALGIVWGSSFYFIEVLLQYINPYMLVFLRVSIASLALISFCLIRKIRFHFTAKIMAGLLLLALMNNVIPFILIAVGQQSITGGLASILNSSTAFFGIMLTPLFFKDDRLTWNRILGVVIGFLGVAVIIGIDNLRGLSHDGIGKFMVIGATICYAFGSMLSKKITRDIPPIISATSMLSFGAITLLVIILVSGKSQFSLITPQIFGIATAFALIGSALAYLLFFEILKHTGASNLTICTIIVPASAIMLDALFLEQFINRSEAIGLLIIIIGLITLDGRLLKRAWSKVG